MVRSTSGPPTATMNDIPTELINRFCAYSDVPTLKALRLSNKEFNVSATEALFRTVELKPTEESADRCESILASDSLRSLVTNVIITTGVMVWGYGGDLPPKFEAQLSKIGQFEKLNHILLGNSNDWSASIGWDYMDSVQDTIEFRHAVLRNLLIATNDKRFPAKLTGLTIANLQAPLLNDLEDQQDLISMLSSLSSLALSMSTNRHSEWFTGADSPAVRHFFATELSNKILVPASNNLRHLKLYSDTYWGYFPFSNLINLTFPCLDSLALGKYTFFCDAQLYWIVSHADSLRSLVLDDCVLLTLGRILGDDYHPPQGPALQDTDYWNTWDWKYLVGWDVYFKVFEEKLCRLRHLAFGRGPCSEGRELEDSDQMTNELRPDRYLVYHTPGDVFPTRYSKATDHGLNMAGCDAQDQKALTQLLSTIHSRAGRRDLSL